MSFTGDNLQSRDIDLYIGAALDDVLYCSRLNFMVSVSHKNPSQYPIMPSVAAKITGRFARRVTRDVVGSITVGTICAYTWWHYSHLPKFSQWREHDLKVKEQMKELNASYYESLNK